MQVKDKFEDYHINWVEESRFLTTASLPLDRIEVYEYEFKSIIILDHKIIQWRELMVSDHDAPIVIHTFWSPRQSVLHFRRQLHATSAWHLLCWVSLWVSTFEAKVQQKVGIGTHAVCNPKISAHLWRTVIFLFAAQRLGYCNSKQFVSYSSHSLQKKRMSNKRFPHHLQHECVLRPIRFVALWWALPTL